VVRDVTLEGVVLQTIGPVPLLASGRPRRLGDRFEGISDPDDMAIVYALEARSGIRGTLVDAFGVYSDPRVGALMRQVPFRTGS
jgi:hypothetical protein